MSFPGQRIAKVMSSRGLCSRRTAELWIKEGRVQVNGRRIDSPALNVSSTDDIRVDRAPIPAPSSVRVWQFHKPRGYITTHKDPQQRPTMFSLLPEHFPRVISVGRLDMDSEGLILLTNQGELAHSLENPATEWVRSYRVRVHGRVQQQKLDLLRDGITIDNVHYKPIQAILEVQMNTNAWIRVQLSEGKNREIRKVFDFLGWPVLRLIRIGFGAFSLGELEEGAVEEIPKHILKKFNITK
ncbi:MAG: rRNA pseudouridine synthase [Oligoflexales bacterium]|nr:rRNA pseudouridine synthase [Oligoflexales bacterium]